MEHLGEIIGGIAVLLGLVVIVGAWRHRGRSRSWPRVEATLESMRREQRREQRGPAESGRIHMVTIAAYRFRNPQTGHDVTGETVLPQSFVGGTGSTLMLAHDPDRPDRVIVPGGSTGGAVAGTLIGLGFIAIGLFAAFGPVFSDPGPGW